MTAGIAQRHIWQVRGVAEDPVDVSAVIAAEYPLFRDGLLGILRGAWPTWRFAQVATFGAVAEQLATEGGDLVLLDMMLVGPSGTAGIDGLCSAHPGSLLAILGDSDDRTCVMECLQAGAHGYILKSATPMQLLRAIEVVLAGGVFAPATLAGKPSPSRFTARQEDVFRLLAEGCSTKTIARRLDLAVGTVKIHLAAIYRTLGVGGRLEALARVRAVGSKAQPTWHSETGSKPASV